MKTSKILIPVLLIVVFNLHVFSQVSQEWVQRYDGILNKDDRVTASCRDAHGNIYITGTTVATNNYYDYVTIKYNSQGVMQWLQRYNGPASGYDMPTAIAVDSAGYVYVTGASMVGTLNQNLYSITTIKYSPTGIESWIKRYNSPQNKGDFGYALAVDDSSNVYITGAGRYSSNSLGIITIKYNKDGIQQWLQVFYGPLGTGDFGYGIAVDKVHNVYVCGSAHLLNGENSDFITLKYNISGGQVWTQRFTGAAGGDDAAKKILLDDSNHIYIGGYAEIGPGDSTDFCTIKYDTSGVLLWRNLYNGPGGGIDMFYDMTIDNRNNVYVTGSSIGNGTNADFATVKYGSNGVEKWVARYDDSLSSDDYGKSVAIDRIGNVYVTGASYNGNDSNSRITTIKYDSAGTLRWKAEYVSPGKLQSTGTNIVLDSSSTNIFVAGSSYGSGTLLDMTLIKYSQPPIGIHQISFELPRKFVLNQNYPNPFNPVCKIQFAIPKSGDTKLVVYDILGREVAELVNEYHNAGTYEALFDGSNLSSGVYFYRLTATDNKFNNIFSETKKMLLVK